MVTIRVVLRLLLQFVPLLLRKGEFADDLSLARQLLLFLAQNHACLLDLGTLLIYDGLATTRLKRKFVQVAPSVFGSPRR